MTRKVFMKNLFMTPVRLFKKDPIMFICSMGGAITGTIALILHYIR